MTRRLLISGVICRLRGQYYPNYSETLSWLSYRSAQYMGVIMYADDLLLISGSVTDLQAMINICMTEVEQS